MTLQTNPADKTATVASKAPRRSGRARRTTAERSAAAPSTTDLNVVVLRGRIATEPQSFDTRDESRVLSFDLVTAGEAGREMTPVSWFDPPAWADELAPGDEVVVVGRVRKRFVRAGASSRPFTDVVAHHAVRATRRRQVEQLLAHAAARLGAC